MSRKKRNIFQRISRRIASLLGDRIQERTWQAWLDEDEEAARRPPESLVEKANGWQRKPLISVVLPVYDVSEHFLRQCIGSVVTQSYPNWELCIADDASPSAHVRRVIEEALASDSRIKAVFRHQNGNISAASNSALALATGDFCALLDHDDELAPHALFELATAIVENPSARIIYSDEDKIDEFGRRFEPALKPDWSRDFFYSTNYLNHLTAIHTSLIRDVGGFRLGFEGSQDYDLLLRCIERINNEQILHTPNFLYHWRALPGSVALAGSEKPYAHELGRKALREHFERTGVETDVVEAVYDRHRVRYRLADPPPRVVVLLTKTDSEGLRRITAKTSYPNCKFAAVDETLASTAHATNADLLCFLDATLVPLNANWLDELARFAMQDGIGCVGARIIGDDGLVIDGAYVVGTWEIASVAHKSLPKNSAANMVRNLVTGNFSAVSSSCMVTRREVFESLGAFDVATFPELFDVDYCLRLQEKGLRIVFAPDVEMTAAHPLQERRPSVEEAVAFRKRWPTYFITGDPFHNANLDGKTGSLKLAARARKS